MVLAQLKELKEVVKQTIDTFEKLITVIDLEKESIIAFDPNSTLEYTNQKENLCLKQSQLFKVQSELMKSISSTVCSTGIAKGNESHFDILTFLKVDFADRTVVL